MTSDRFGAAPPDGRGPSAPPALTVSSPASKGVPSDAGRRSCDAGPLAGTTKPSRRWEHVMAAIAEIDSMIEEHYFDRPWWLYPDVEGMDLDFDKGEARKGSRPGVGRRAPVPRLRNSARCRLDVERIAANADREKRGDEARRELIGRGDARAQAGGPPGPWRDRERHQGKGPAPTTPRPVIDDAGAERMGQAAEAPEPATRKRRKPAEPLRARISASRNAEETGIGSASDRRPSEAVAVCVTCRGTFPKTRPWARFCTTRCRMVHHKRIRPPEGAE